MDHCVCAGCHGFGGFAGFVGVADEYGVGGASCFDVGHGVAYERRSCWGGPGAGEVVCCGGGVGGGDGFDFVGGEGGVDVPGSGFQRGGHLPSGNPLAGCGRVGLLQQR